MDNLKLEIVQRNLETKFAGRNMVCFKEIDSTSNFASGLAFEVENHNLRYPLSRVSLNGAVIVAEKQNKGRGRFERQWVSPSGGLWFTIINQPQIILKDLSKITFLAAASIIDVLKEEIENNYKKDAEKLSVKWPNDIYYDGKKLSGILCETENFCDNIYLFTGIGINVNFSTAGTSFSELGAISLFDITGKITNRSCLLAKLINAFEKNYEYFQKSGDFKSIFRKIEKIITF